MKHNFEPIRNPLEQILQKYQLNETLEINALFDQWEQVVGKTLARISKPSEYDRDTHTLIISTVSDAWRKEINDQKNELLKKVNHKFEAIKVKEIRFV